MKPDDSYDLFNQKMLADKMRCSQCYKYPESPMFCDACNLVYCTSCTPYCKVCLQSNLRRNLFIENCLQELTLVCDCGQAIQRRDRAQHSLQCKAKLVSCPVPDCPFEGSEGLFVRHVCSVHPLLLAQNMSQLFAVAPPQSAYECTNCGEFYNTPAPLQRRCPICGSA